MTRKGNASEAIKSFELASRKFKDFCLAFLKLPPDRVGTMQQNSELFANGLDEDEVGISIPPKFELQSYENLLYAMATDLENEKKRIVTAKQELWGGSDGRGELVRAKEIALAVAKIYLRLQQKAPTCGTNQTKQKSQAPSTPYAKVVYQVFKNLGLTADVRVPCEEAIKKIREGDSDQK